MWMRGEAYHSSMASISKAWSDSSGCIVRRLVSCADGAGISGSTDGFPSFTEKCWWLWSDLMVGSPQAVIYRSRAFVCRQCARKCSMSPPHGHATGSLNLDPGAILLIFSSGTLDQSKTDDFRFPVDRWPIRG